MKKNHKIILVYSHQNKSALRRLLYILKYLEIVYDIDIWYDEKIEPGKHWPSEIKKACETATIAVLLVSNSFLSSEFILKYEVPPLLRAAKLRKLIIIQIFLDFIKDNENFEKLQQFQAINSIDNPYFFMMTDAQMDAVSRKTAKAIESILRSKLPYKETRNNINQAIIFGYCILKISLRRLIPQIYDCVIALVISLPMLPIVILGWFAYAGWIFFFLCLILAYISSSASILSESESNQIVRFGFATILFYSICVIPVSDVSDKGDAKIIGSFLGGFVGAILALLFFSATNITALIGFLAGSVLGIFSKMLAPSDL